MPIASEFDRKMLASIFEEPIEKKMKTKGASVMSGASHQVSAKGKRKKEKRK